jgi:hypothetical protein
MSSGTPLRFVWTDGSALKVAGKTYVWCGNWDDGAAVRTLRIQQSSPFSPPWWFLEIRLKLARRGRKVAFPALMGRTGTMFVAYPRKRLEAQRTASARGGRSLFSATSAADRAHRCG